MNVGKAWSVVLGFALCSSAVWVGQSGAEDWPQWRGPRRDGTWTTEGLLEELPATPKVLWSMPIGAGYSGPTVADGRVFVTDRLDDPTEVERIHCFDFQTGKALWTREYACDYGAIGYKAGPRAAVSVDGNYAYALGATGRLHCLNVANGETVWQRDLDAEYDISREDNQNRMPIWGISASPLLFEDLLILQIGGREKACVVALDKLTGAERWRALDDQAQYSAPILIRQAGRDVVVVWTGDSVAGMDARSGEVYWRHVMKPTRMPIGCATPIVHGDMLFVTSFYDGSLMLKLDQDQPAVSEVWRAIGPSEQDTRALHSIISTPIWLDEHIYGVDSYGELRCLEASTGARVWEDTTATPKARWSTIHFTQNGEKTWMFNERGELLISRLSPAGFEELSRTRIIEPTMEQLRRRQGVCWAHPAFADGRVLARNDNRIVCIDIRSQ